MLAIATQTKRDFLEAVPTTTMIRFADLKMPRVGAAALNAQDGSASAGMRQRTIRAGTAAMVSMRTSSWRLIDSLCQRGLKRLSRACVQNHRVGAVMTNPATESWLDGG